MVGFEVTPLTAASRSVRSSSPLWISLRDRTSIQTLCPSSVSSCSLLLAMAHLPFQLLNLFEAPHVAVAAAEARGQKGAHELGGQLGPPDLRPEAEHVHVVVLDALMRRVGVVADRCANSHELGGRDGRADARSAHEHAALGVAGADRVAHLARLVGVVDPLGVGVGPEVDRVVAERIDLAEDARAQLHASVVERSGYPHDVTLPLDRALNPA